MRKYWGDAADNFQIRGTPYAQGRILKDMLASGVQEVGDPTQFHAVANDARAPMEDGGLAMRLDCVPFSVVVNRDVERYYDEGEDVWPKRYAIWGRLIAQQPDQVAFAINDSKAQHNYLPPVFAPYEAGSIAELAGMIGLDAGKLEKVVADYNAAVRPAPSARRRWTIAAPRVSPRRNPTGPGASVHHPITATRCDRASPSPSSR